MPTAGTCLPAAAGFWREHRLVLAFLCLMAATGVVLAVDGIAQGALGHKLFALGCGALLLAPFLVALRGRRSGLRFLRRVCFALTPALLLAGCIEVALRVLDVEVVGTPSLQPDPVLGHVLAPGEAGMDALGFRNRTVPERADVVCIGDSQTWGFGLRRSETWPSVLAERLGRTVYNMSNGGYGPLQYLALAESCQRLRPAFVVVAFYLGNDIYEAHAYAALEHWRSMRADGLVYRGTDVNLRSEPSSTNLAIGLVEAMSRRSRLLGLAQHTFLAWLKTRSFLADAFWKESDGPRYDTGRIRTLFTPRMRQEALDLERPENRDGLRITAICLDRIHDACRQRGTALVVLLIHTKEYCYRALMQARGEAVPDAIATLAAAEGKVTAALTAHVRDLGVRLLDPADEIVRTLAADTPLWGPTADGHVNPAGCVLFADTVAACLREIDRPTNR